jgi:hypothetical protein
MATVDDIAAFLLPNFYECNLDSLNMLYTYTDSMDHQRFANLEQPTELQMHLDTMLPSMEYLVDAYFTKVHPYWPILHAPTFSVKNVSYILLGSIALLADWVDGSSQHEALAGVMFEVLISIQPVSTLCQSSPKLTRTCNIELKVLASNFASSIAICGI